MVSPTLDFVYALVRDFIIWVSYSKGKEGPLWLNHNVEIDRVPIANYVVLGCSTRLCSFGP